MFGYVIPNQGELKVRELSEYRGWYCGLCCCLDKEYGTIGRISLNYDMTFLALLLSSLYDSPINSSTGRCMVHPWQKHKRYDSAYLHYAAAMNIILTYYKCLDDWQDDHNILHGGYGILLHRAEKNIKKDYPKQVESIKSCLEKLGNMEKDLEKNLDEVSGVFGKLCGDIFAKEDDIWYQDLWHMGFYLGKFIYLLDAWDDLEQDQRDGNYNPLLLFLKDSYDSTDVRSKKAEQYVKSILTEMISRACRYFERLPIVDNVEILRNILYSGVWTKFNKREHDRRNIKNGAKEG